MASTALLATVADAKASQLAGGVAPVMPAGVILPFGGATAPTGWLVCDGSQVSRTQYADLFAAIGTAHGSGDGSSTFHLPDFRGRFLRGADGGAGRDPDKASRTAANSGGAVGDAVGSVQGNATAKNALAVSGGTASGTFGSSSHSHTYVHTHTIPIGNDGASFWWSNAVRGNSVINDQNYSVSNTNFHNPGYRRYDMPTISQSASTSSGNSSSASVSSTGASLGNGDSETRPTNANVSYIIKV